MKQGEQEILHARDSVGQNSGATQWCPRPRFSDRIRNSRPTPTNACFHHGLLDSVSCDVVHTAVQGVESAQCLVVERDDVRERVSDSDKPVQDRLGATRETQVSNAPSQLTDLKVGSAVYLTSEGRDRQREPWAEQLHEFRSFLFDEGGR